MKMPSWTLLRARINQRQKTWHIVLLTLLVLFTSLPGLAGLQVIDRDEARYAQASVQMRDSGDYVNIRFQDRARNKKPAGVYWLQVASLKMLSDPNSRDIWVHRVPSVLGALLAVLATYWAGIMLFGTRAAFLGAIILASSVLFIFEAHIAKTDALLCAVSTLCLCLLIKVRNTAHAYTPSTNGILQSPRVFAGMFWVALGVGIMIKGPVIPALVLFTLMTLYMWEHHLTGFKSLLYWLGPLLCVAIVLPWVILIGMATDGQFFAESVGKDFGSKLGRAQENHGAPFGAYFVTIWLLFWPGCLLLVPAAVWSIKSLRDPGTDGLRKTNIRVLLSWVIPFWLALELIPTKLPHYLLPLYPALALLCGAMLSSVLGSKNFKVSSRINAFIFGLISLVLIGLLPAINTALGSDETWPYLLAIVLGLITLGIIFAVWTFRFRMAVAATLLVALLLNGSLYKFIFPNLELLQVSERLAKAVTLYGVDLPRRGGPIVLSPQYTEPSLIYHFGKEVRLGDQMDVTDPTQFKFETLILSDTLSDTYRETEDMIDEAIAPLNLCKTPIGRVAGINISKGEKVDIIISQLTWCDYAPVAPS